MPQRAAGCQHFSFHLEMQVAKPQFLASMAKRMSLPSFTQPPLIGQIMYLRQVRPRILEPWFSFSQLTLRAVVPYPKRQSKKTRDYYYYPTQHPSVKQEVSLRGKESTAPPSHPSKVWSRGSEIFPREKGSP